MAKETREEDVKSVIYDKKVIINVKALYKECMTMEELKFPVPQ